VGVEITVEGLTKSFGRQVIWQDVSLTLPAGEISVMLGPSGTGKSVFLKTLIGLLRPDRGSVVIDGTDITRVNERKLYEVRKLFGVLFQDGALFGSQTLYDNIAFPLREHTRKSEKDIRSIVMDKMEKVGLLGAEGKLPGEISGGMRKRAGLARALVLDPQIILCDEPDSGLDPVRTAYLNQLIIDLNAQIEATFLIVTHDINTARTVPDNIGLLFRRNLVMFGPREELLTSTEPVVRQFMNGRREGPIGMAEEKDAAALAAEEQSGPAPELPDVEPQLRPSPGLERRSQRHREITTSVPAAVLRKLLEEGGSYADLADESAVAEAASAEGEPTSAEREPTPAAPEPAPAGSDPVRSAPARRRPSPRAVADAGAEPAAGAEAVRTLPVKPASAPRGRGSRKADEAPREAPSRSAARSATGRLRSPGDVEPRASYTGREGS
jgi:phospholipid/cholesterol/gamma-HCH transport system ATP-binding protein